MNRTTGLGVVLLAGFLSTACTPPPPRVELPPPPTPVLTYELTLPDLWPLDTEVGLR
ncbi:MAG: hypothetical protein HY699_05855 [Deltaproteobacteria bacterium]|nr:hypothetical protein [Deltaproteobacteria bacterium]